ncbi:MAG: HNH endonuclease [Elusimicrobia bacterium]|nr:HNH endonuclease [Elusimicrobiota bacterium]
MHVARERPHERERLHRWYLANTEKVKAAAREWALEHPEKAREAAARCRARRRSKRRDDLRAWRAANPEKARELSREGSRRRRATNPERSREEQRAWRVANPGATRETYRAWRLANLERARILNRVGSSRRRTRKRGSGGSHTAAEWIALCWASAWRCAYCGDVLNEKTAQQEHKVPISRGGSDDIENIALSCKSCNSRKHSMTDVEFLQRRSVL